jgi:hypothetical protein
MTVAVQRQQFFGIGVNWNRRSIFEYGWVALDLPFFTIIFEWSPDHEAFDRKYGAEVRRTVEAWDEV